MSFKVLKTERKKKIENILYCQFFFLKKYNKKKKRINIFHIIHMCITTLFPDWKYLKKKKKTNVNPDYLITCHAEMLKYTNWNSICGNNTTRYRPYNRSNRFKRDRLPQDDTPKSTHIYSCECFCVLVYVRKICCKTEV